MKLEEVFTHFATGGNGWALICTYQPVITCPKNVTMYLVPHLSVKLTDLQIQISGFETFSETVY